MLRRLRIVILLFILAVVAIGSWQQRRMATDWQEPLWVAIHPVSGDGSAAADATLARLDVTAFAPLETFFAHEAQRYRVALTEPFTVRLAPRLAEPPPLPPAQHGLLSTVWWSLRLRWWSWRVGEREASPPADIRVYVRYFDPATRPSLPHSVGVAEGRIGIANLFAGTKYAGSNLLVVAHEVLHTLGATDKYDPANNLPVHPQGYAEPELRPLHPQRKAELMAGRIPLSPGEARMPRAFNEVAVGETTAREIRWVE